MTAQFGPIVRESYDDADPFDISEAAAKQGEYPYTDMGNALRFVRDWEEDIRYCPEWKSWLVWDGTRWRRDVNGRIYELAKQTIVELWLEAGSPYDETKARWALYSQNGTRLEAMVKVARTDERIVANVWQLDTRQHLFNCTNCTVDLQTGLALEHNRDHLITKVAGVGYDPEAKCPKWDAQVQWMTKGDPELVTYLQRLAGYSLIGSTEERKIVIMHGSTAGNGKSTYLDTVLMVTGDYGSPVDPSLIEKATFKRSGSEARPDEANLQGVRYAAGSELRSDTTMDTAKVKKLTSTEPVRARRLYENESEFRLTCTIWLSTNELPKVDAEDQAIWDRLATIPCTARIFDDPDKKDQIISDYAQLLFEEEGSGILGWAVRGALDYQRHGLQEPQAVSEANQAYREDMDFLGLFFNYVDEMEGDFEYGVISLSNLCDHPVTHELIEDLDENDPGFLKLPLEIRKGLLRLRRSMVDYSATGFRKLYNDMAKTNEWPRLDRQRFTAKLLARGWALERRDRYSSIKVWKWPKRKLSYADLSKRAKETDYA